MAAIEKHTGSGRGSATRPPTGLLLSIGDKTISKSGREIPTRIDWIRPKEGALEQYAEAVQTYHDVYGEQPKQLDDLFFLSNHIGDVQDIRLKAWGTSGIRLVGDTNYATLPKDEWEDRAFAFDDEVTFYPLSANEVRREIRDAWEGEPIRDRLNGPKDPRIEKLGINVECTLTFCLPKVLGFGTTAQISTKSRRSMRNLVSSVWDQWTFLQGNLSSVPFRLSVRPARGRRFDRDQRKYVMFDFFELVLDTPFTVQEAIDAIRTRRLALGGGQPGPGSPEARQLTEALALPAGPGEEMQLREEPSAFDGPDDALLNRIARLETEVEQAAGPGAPVTTLRGVFGVETAADLSQEDAERYEQILERSLPEAEFVDPEDIEFGEEEQS